MAVLTQFSRKRAVVVLLEREEEKTGNNEYREKQESGFYVEGQLEMYSDVEIFAARKDGRAIFNGVYAKVVECKENELILHFTHVNQSFQGFAEELLS